MENGTGLSCDCFGDLVVIVIVDVFRNLVMAVVDVFGSIGCCVFFFRKNLLLLMWFCRRARRLQIVAVISTQQQHNTHAHSTC